MTHVGSLSVFRVHDHVCLSSSAFTKSFKFVIITLGVVREPEKLYAILDTEFRSITSGVHGNKTGLGGSIADVEWSMSHSPC